MTEDTLVTIVRREIAKLYDGFKGTPIQLFKLRSAILTAVLSLDGDYHYKVLVPDEESNVVSTAHSAQSTHVTA